MQLAGFVVENSKNISDFGTIWCPTNLPQSNREKIEFKKYIYIFCGIKKSLSLKTRELFLSFSPKN